MGLQDRPIYRRDFIISYSNRVVHDVIGKFYRMHANIMESVASVLRKIQKSPWCERNVSSHTMDSFDLLEDYAGELTQETTAPSPCLSL